MAKFNGKTNKYRNLTESLLNVHFNSEGIGIKGPKPVEKKLPELSHGGPPPHPPQQQTGFLLDQLQRYGQPGYQMNSNMGTTDGQAWMAESSYNLQQAGPNPYNNLTPTQSGAGSQQGQAVPQAPQGNMIPQFNNNPFAQQTQPMPQGGGLGVPNMGQGYSGGVPQVSAPLATPGDWSTFDFGAAGGGYSESAIPPIKTGLSPAEVAKAQADMTKQAGNAAFARSTVSTVGNLIAQSDDTTDDVRPSSSGRDILGSAMSGAAAGSVAGPWGALAGAAVSVGAGLLNSKKAGEEWDKNKAEESELNQEQRGNNSLEYSKFMQNNYDSQGGDTGSYYAEYGGSIDKIMKKYNDGGEVDNLYADIKQAGKLNKYIRRSNIMKLLPTGSFMGMKNKNKQRIVDSRLAIQGLQLGKFDWNDNVDKDGNLISSHVLMDNRDPFYEENIWKDNNNNRLGTKKYNWRQVNKRLKGLNVVANEEDGGYHIQPSPTNNMQFAEGGYTPELNLPTREENVSEAFSSYVPVLPYQETDRDIMENRLGLAAGAQQNRFVNPSTFVNSMENYKNTGEFTPVPYGGNSSNYKEWDPRVSSYIEDELFPAVGYDQSIQKAQNTSGDGTPWSAATISDLAMAVDPEFRGSAAHASYITDAFQGNHNWSANKSKRNTDYAAGDILFSGRGDTRGKGFNWFKNQAKSGNSYKSHSDMIVATGTNADGETIYTVQGGNLGDTLSTKDFTAKQLNRKYPGYLRYSGFDEEGNLLEQKYGGETRKRQYPHGGSTHMQKPADMDDATWANLQATQGLTNFAVPAVKNDRLTDYSDVEMRQNEEIVNRQIGEEALQNTTEALKTGAGNTWQYITENPLDAAQIGIGGAAIVADGIPGVGTLASGVLDGINAGISGGRAGYYGLTNKPGKAAFYTGLAGLDATAAIPGPVGDAAGASKISALLGKVAKSKAGHYAHEGAQVATKGKAALAAEDISTMAAGGSTNAAEYETEGGEVMLASPADAPVATEQGRYDKIATNLYKAEGPRHEQGGVPTAGATQSFRDASGQIHNAPYVYSDSPDMMMDPTEILKLIS